MNENAAGLLCYSGAPDDNYDKNLLLSPTRLPQNPLIFLYAVI
jgi:hypothetical protein